MTTRTTLGPDGQKYCVYFHLKPDGTIFYVGKGTYYRAHEIAPSRRTQHHRNVTAKYGRESIRIEVIWCDSEEAAFKLERTYIALCKMYSLPLVNLTEGGEGASGRKFSPEQTEAHREAVKRGWTNRPRKEIKPKRFPELTSCKQCGAQFSRMTSRHNFCNAVCSQRFARKDIPKKALATYKTNTSGRVGVYEKKNGRWLAMIGVDGKLKCLGTYKTMEEAIAVREAAEREIGRAYECHQDS